MQTEFITARRNHHRDVLASGAKVCNRCGETKPLAEFVRQTRTKSGVGAYCRPCWRVIVREWDAAHPAKRRGSHMKSRYGITPEGRTALLEESDGLCWACYEEPATCVDHDHTTDEVRGMLCRDCNLALGHLNDDPARLLSLLEYLEEKPDGD